MLMMLVDLILPQQFVAYPGNQLYDVQLLRSWHTCYVALATYHNTQHKIKRKYKIGTLKPC